MTLQPTAAAPVDADLWWTVYFRGALLGREESYATGVFVGRSMPINPETKKPERRDRMVLLRRDGGASEGLFDQPRMTVDVWAMKDKDATDLANLILALAKVAPLSGAGVVSVTNVTGPSTVADPSGQPRRLCSFEPLHRATIIEF